jgi:RNA polymerase sigma factor (TIGR02999 family)
MSWTVPRTLPSLVLTSAWAEIAANGAGAGPPGPACLLDRPGRWSGDGGLPMTRRDSAHEEPDASDARAGREPAGGQAAEAADVAPDLSYIYDELRRLAHRHLEREATGHTLTTTDLVHQAYVHLAGQTRARWAGRAHFMATAAIAMRRILVDHARAHASLKRGGRLRRVPLESADLAVEDRAELLLALDEALQRLRGLDERQARVVECRFFAGMTEAETAEALGIGVRTVKRDWAKAKAWLYRELYGDA